MPRRPPSCSAANPPPPPGPPPAARGTDSGRPLLRCVSVTPDALWWPGPFSQPQDPFRARPHPCSYPPSVCVSLSLEGRLSAHLVHPLFATPVRWQRGAAKSGTRSGPLPPPRDRGEVTPPVIARTSERRSGAAGIHSRLIGGPIVSDPKVPRRNDFYFCL